MVIFNSEIEALIKEDVPYLDLTTTLLNLHKTDGIMNFYAREEMRLSCIEEACRVIKMCGGSIECSLETGVDVRANKVILKARGGINSLLSSWKVAQNLIEYQSAIATKTRDLVQKAKAINPKVEILTTRKSVPLTKKFSIKSILAGGAYPHRLGLSETILIFLEHMNLYGGVAKLLSEFETIKEKAVEKKVGIELKEIDFAIEFAKKGVDIIQFDKLEIEEVFHIVQLLKDINPNIKILVAGGINLENVEQYAKTKVDGIVLSSIYFAKPKDVRVEIIVR